MQGCVPGMAAVVYERLGGLVFLSDLNQLRLAGCMRFTEVSAKPALAFLKVLHRILPSIEPAKAHSVSVCAARDRAQRKRWFYEHGLANES
jgi:hypothetical protein